MANGYQDPAPGTCGALKSSDDWGWSLVRCTKPEGHRGKHIADEQTSFGGATFAAIWSEGDERAQRYYYPASH